MNITIRAARKMLQATTTVTSGTHTVLTKLANGESSAAEIPYDLDEKARQHLQTALEICESIVKFADKVLKTKTEIMAGGVGKGINSSDNPVLFANWSKLRDQIEDSEVDRPFIQVMQDGLKISNANPIPGIVVAALRPILNDNTPAPDPKLLLKSKEPIVKGNSLEEIELLEVTKVEETPPPPGVPAGPEKGS